MKYQRFLLVAFSLAAAFSLQGCGNSEERDREKAKARLSFGKELYLQNQLDRAEAAFREVLAHHPSTEAAKEAEAWLNAVPGKRENNLRQASYEVLGRVRDIIDGYRTVYGTFPASLKEMDESGYFFDSHYLAGVVPADFTLYLVLHGKERYEALAVHQGQSQGYAYDSAPAAFRRFADPAELTNLEQAAAPLRIGNLVTIPAPAPRG